MMFTLRLLFLLLFILLLFVLSFVDIELFFDLCLQYLAFLLFRIHEFVVFTETQLSLVILPTSQ